MISILILTKNEERDLPGCLESVSWSDDIHIYDSMSTDETVAIAERFGAKITQREYSENSLAFGGDEAAHRNWGLKNIAFKYPWVLQLDADERATDDLVKEMKTILPETKHAAFRIRRRDFLMDRWLKHVQATPYYIRLFQPDKLYYERLINPVTRVNGSTGELRFFFDHFPFSKGFHHWLDKHNHYSSLEARQIIYNRRTRREYSPLKAFISRDFNERRFHQKELFYRLPLRPFIKFLIIYVLKRGFLDGKAGLTYATLQSIYEYMIVLKTRELEAIEKQKC